MENEPGVRWYDDASYRWYQIDPGTIEPEGIEFMDAQRQPDPVPDESIPF